MSGLTSSYLNLLSSFKGPQHPCPTELGLITRASPPIPCGRSSLLHFGIDISWGFFSHRKFLCEKTNVFLHIQLLKSPFSDSFCASKSDKVRTSHVESWVWVSYRFKQVGKGISFERSSFLSLSTFKNQCVFEHLIDRMFKNPCVFEHRKDKKRGPLAWNTCFYIMNLY